MGKKKGKTSLDSFMGSPKTKDKKAQDSPRSKKAKSSKKGNKTKERKSAKPKASMVAFRRATRDYEKTDPSIKPSAKKAENTEQIKVDGERISIETGATAKKKEEQHKADTTPLKKNYFPKNTEPIGDMAIPFDMPRERRESQQSWHLRQLFKKGDVITDMERGVLLTVEYSGKMNKAYAKFYDLADHKIKIWIDTTNHEPYCLHREKMEVLEEHEDLQSYNGLKRMETVKRYDLLQDKEIKVTKIYGETPTDIGGARGIKATLDGAWEANIRYHHNFIYDRGLVPGLFYTIKNGKLTQIKPEIDDQLQSELEKIFQGAKPEMKEMAKVYQPIFYTPVPKMKRVAFDIEVEDTDDGMVPNPRSAKYEIISVAFVDNEEKKFVYILDRKNVEEGNYPEDFPKDAEVFFFKDEKTLLEETFRVIWDYPIVITFNGDNFDNMYLYHRAKRLKIDEKINPIYTARGGGMVSNYTYYKHSVHIDIFQFYANRSIKGYAFGSAYLQNSLEEISTGLLGEGKIKHEDTSIGAMTLADLVYYNLTDSIRTMELTTFNDELMFHLLVILARITKLPLQDVFRYQISTWIKSLMIFEHRRKNFLIPRRRELNEKDQQSTVGPVIEGKGFKGAYVITPKPGIHFEVAVLDFSSLYPSIIKTKNLSYETVNCVHEECQENMLPNTPFWSCTKKMGVFAYVVGYFRDVRVNWFKPRIKAKELSKEERKRANVMASALKVFINGAYGVFGSPVFQFYCLRVAESTNEIGRF